MTEKILWCRETLIVPRHAIMISNGIVARFFCDPTFAYKLLRHRLN